MQGVIPPLCELFNCPDPKIIMVAMEGIENILRVGKQDSANHPKGENVYASFVEECHGLDYLEYLQKHDNEEIYEKAVKILRTYFDSEEEEEGAVQAPAVSEGGNQFTFGQPQQPGAGNQFSF